MLVLFQTIFTETTKCRHEFFLEKYKSPKILGYWLLEKLDVNQSSFAESKSERQRSIVESIICEAENAGKLFWIRSEDEWQLLS